MPNCFAWKNINSQPPLVQVLDVDGTTGECGDELNLGVIKEVVIAAGESGVGLLFDLENHITGNDTRRLVSLSSKLDLGAALHTTVNMNVEHLPVDNRLLAAALLAAILVLKNLALPVAVGTDGLEALDHGTHLPHHRLHAVTVTASTPPDCTLLAASTLALRAYNGALECKLGNLSAVDILK